MAFLLGLDSVSLEYPHKVLLKEQSLGVFEGERIGIVGKNGEGKSSLLRILAQLQEADSGRQLISSGVEIGYLGQHDDLDSDKSVRENLVGDAPEYTWASEARIREILNALLADIDWEQALGRLSGGQRRRVDLARVLIGQPEVLMLDEPTNHLDIESIHWLAQHLKSRWPLGTGALLMITHDRWFLDEVCTSMWEVHDGRVDAFEGGYSAYILQRVEREALEHKRYQKLKNIARRELAWLSRGAQARSTKPKFRVKRAQELLEGEPPLRQKLDLKTSALTRLGKQVIDFKRLSFTYGVSDKDGVPAGSGDAAGASTSQAQALSPTADAARSAATCDPYLIKDLDFIIGAGDRIGIIGANGVGKSSLFKLIEGKLQPTSGQIKLGKTVKLASLTQGLDELAPFMDSRVKDVLAKYKTSYVLDGEELSSTQLLERLGFEKGQLMTYVHALSGGQQRRLQLMLTLLDKPNVLLLDEPGNDLDTDMLALMEDVLDSWPGTLLLITHDRYLMERVTDNQYALLGGKLVHLPSGVDEYLDLLKQGAYRSTKKAGVASSCGTATSAADSGTSKPMSASDKKLSAAQMRDLKKRRDSLERKMKTAQERLEAEEQALTEVDPTQYEALVEQQERIKEKQEALEELELEWLEVMELIEEG